MAKIHDSLQQLKSLADQFGVDIREIGLTAAQWEEYTSENWRVQEVIVPKKISKKDRGLTVLSVFE